jgi:hypothetical protein
LLRECRAVQQHAERAAYVAEDFENRIGDVLVLGGHCGFGRDRIDARHVGLLP